MAEVAATLATPIVDRLVACVSDSSARHMRYLTRFEENHDSLWRKMSELFVLRDHVKEKVQVAVETQQHMQQTPLVTQWLERVELIAQEVDAVLQECSREIEQRCCVNYCPKNWWSRYKLGKKVCKKLKVVEDELSKGGFEEVAYKVLPSRVEIKNEDHCVGMDEAFSEVSSWLENDAVQRIGIYGMGGVGKTTLLKKINNMFEKKEDHTFNLVIWVTVSSQLSIQNVQKQISRRLGLSWSDDEDQNDKAQRIYDALCRKKFFLLLDDIWKPIEFDKIGIPCQNHHSKVVFTTRSESVCGEMEADKKFRVSVLDWQQAWKLFQQKVGQEALNSQPEIPKLAKAVAIECGGLPLALITIGRAMRIKKTTRQWIHALTTLKKYSSEFEGMENKVLSILKFSYDNLEDDTARDCFLYFSLYPEDWKIEINVIIRQWIGEGFLDKFKDMDDALNKGHDIIGSLKAACLLETTTWGDSGVKMHDLVRDLALWITSDSGRKEKKHLVQACETEGWEDAERISIVGGDLKELTGAPECPLLVTLMLRENDTLLIIPDDFFCNMPNLRVLDLSDTRIKVVPKSIAGLLQLQYLDFELTDIEELPEELGKLVKLKYFNLGQTDVTSIPCGMISCFPRLQMLDLGAAKLDDSLIVELESLEQLRELGITIREIPTPLSHKLISCINQLEIRDCVGLTELSLLSSSSSLLIPKTRRLHILTIQDCLELETLKINCLEVDEEVTGPLFTLEELELWDLPKLNNIIWAETAAHLHFKHLSNVTIISCPILKEISWLVLVPFLMDLDVRDCLELEEIILCRFTTTIDGSPDIFSRLQNLSLKELPKLKSIVSVALLVPCLQEIYVSDCPMLKKLPLVSNSTDKSNLVIHCSTEWWNELQWEDQIVKSSFQPFIDPIQESKSKDEESKLKDEESESEDKESESEDEESDSKDEESESEDGESESEGEDEESIEIVKIVDPFC